MTIPDHSRAAGSGGPPLVAATTAMLVWPHRRGGPAHSLVRLRTIRGATLDPPQPGLVTVAVISELRDNPRGFEIGSDFAGAATAAWWRLVPRACPPAAVTWYAHHGEFSSYDPTGPETLTQIPLRWDTDHYLQAPLERHRLLTSAQLADYTAVLHLQPVADVLAADMWDLGADPASPAPAG